MNPMNKKKLILIGDNFINVDAIARVGIKRDLSDLSITLIDGTQIFLDGPMADAMTIELRRRCVDLNPNVEQEEEAIFD
jgi:hypothetical protein